MTRKEHIEWCKQRAREYLDSGDDDQAFASMCSDLLHHPETANHAGIEIGTMMIMTGNMRNMREFIEGFN